MTNKVYKSAQGKSVDLGTIMLQNEHVRAVGNMNVNARGDKLDQNNRVVETKPRQIQRQNARTTNVSDEMIHTSGAKARRAKKEKSQVEQQPDLVQPSVSVPEEAPIPVAAPAAQNIATPKAPSGLAAAIARNREIKQELEKTRREQSTTGLRKL